MDVTTIPLHTDAKAGTNIVAPETIQATMLKNSKSVSIVTVIAVHATDQFSRMAGSFKKIVAQAKYVK
jgi:hypothetical protein